MNPVPTVETRPGLAPVRTMSMQLEPLGVQVLAPARNRLRTWLDTVAVPEEQVAELLVAVCEACLNSLEHSGTRTPIRIEAAVSSEEIRVLVRDRGRWKDPEPMSGIGRGHGRTVMEALVDRVEVRTDAAGTVVTLIQSRRRRSKADGASDPFWSGTASVTARPIFS